MTEGLHADVPRWATTPRPRRAPRHHPDGPGTTWLRRGRTARDERGNVTIEMVVLFPLLVLVLLSALQIATVYQAQTVAMAAAELAARSSARMDATLGAGYAEADSFIRQAGALRNPQVSGTRGVTTTTFIVTGDAVRLIPGWNVRVSHSAALPVERLTR